MSVCGGYGGGVGGGASLWSGNLVSPCCLFLLRHRSLRGNRSISVLTGLSADSSLDASSPYSSWQPITALHSLHFLPLAEDVKKRTGYFMRINGSVNTSQRKGTWLTDLLW